jgi:hypothetical protein
VHLPPRKPLENRVCHVHHFLQFFYSRILSEGKPGENRAMMRNKVLQEDDIQKLHTTSPEQLTDQELLLSTISVADLARKTSDGWDKEHPKCLFCDKVYRFRTFTVQCHMTSQVTHSGKHKCETAVCSMESTKDDSPLKARFFTV